MIDLKHYKNRLMVRKQELDERLRNIEHDLDLPMNADVEERATEREDDEVLETMGNAGLQEIEAIDAALSRIDANTFGVCIECGEPISEKRLEIMPTATRCIKCM